MTIATGNSAGRRSAGSSTSRARSRSTWSRRRSRPRAFACACPTARCSASPTSPYTARSSCPAQPTPSMSERSRNICRSASPRSASCRALTPRSTPASCAASTNRRSGESGLRELRALLDDHRRADMDATIEIDHVHVAHADAAGRNGLADFRRLVRAVNAVERVLVALKEIKCSGAERIIPPALKRSVGDIGPELRPALHDRGGWHPRRPFLHLPYGGAAGPGVGFHTGRDPVAHGPVVGQDEIEIARAGVDDDRARPFAGVIVNEAAGVGYAPLVGLCERHHLLVALGELRI